MRSSGETGPDPVTGDGVTGSAGLYPSFYKQYLIDGYASGSVEAFGRRHQLAFGVSNGWASDLEYDGDADTGIDYGDIRQLSSFTPTEPSFATPELQARVHDRLTRLYGAAHLDLADRLKGVVGVSAIWLRTTGNDRLACPRTGRPRERALASHPCAGALLRRNSSDVSSRNT